MIRVAPARTANGATVCGMLLIWASVALVAIGCSDSLVRGRASDAGPDAATPVDVGTSDTGVGTDTGGSEDVGADVRTPTGPPYPIVLAHGFAGFEHLADVEGLDYYFGVEEALEEAGEVVVIGEVDPFNDSTDRGEELIREIEAFLERTPHRRVNIIGHSQGGLDARYVAHHRPHMVGAVVTISAPHRGTLIADIVLEIVEHELFRDVVDEIVQLFGKPLYDEAGNETSLFDALEQFSEPGIEKFNRKITDRRGVYYASVAGRTDGHLGESYCASSSAPQFVRRWADQGDPVDPFLSLTEGIVDGAGSRERPNDGLVRVSDAKWGDFLGCIPADHLDEVGQLVGDSPGGGNDWDHLEFYRRLADFLHQKGY